MIPRCSYDECYPGGLEMAGFGDSDDEEEVRDIFLNIWISRHKIINYLKIGHFPTGGPGVEEGPLGVGRRGRQGEVQQGTVAWSYGNAMNR